MSDDRRRDPDDGEETKVGTEESGTAGLLDATGGDPERSGETGVTGEADD